MEHTQSSSGADVLAADLTMGPVELNVRDLGEMRDFYERVIGLDPVAQDERSVTLGSDGVPVIVLHGTPDLPLPPLGSAGLYHAALLFSSRGLLARTMERVLASVPQLFAGSADHLVSEAFYLTDPEGNGIELYVDRDPSAWVWENGLVKMDSLYLPPGAYIGQHKGDESAGKIGIGHVHLRVGDAGEARRFYVDVIGFSVTSRMPSALFVSVNKYHHHLGMNTWESAGAGGRGETLGLRSFGLILPARADLERLTQRLARGGAGFEDAGGGISLADPWNNRIVVSVR